MSQVVETACALRCPVGRASLGEGGGLGGSWLLRIQVWWSGGRGGVLRVDALSESPRPVRCRLKRSLGGQGRRPVCVWCRAPHTLAAPGACELSGV
jgi:hypothetical protein